MTEYDADLEEGPEEEIVEEIDDIEIDEEETVALAESDPDVDGEDDEEGEDQ